jgi:Cytochrome P460
VGPGEAEGLGAAYPPSERTGEWELAEFRPDGAPRADAKLAECRTCHRKQAAQDYAFRFYKFLQELKD